MDDIQMIIEKPNTYEKEMKTRVEELLDKLNKGTVDNDQEFLDCLLDLDYRLKKLEKGK